MNVREIIELKKRVLSCNKCSLRTTCKSPVFGRGSIMPDVLIVGEAPGLEEDEKSLPFVGRSGSFLQKIIDSVELESYAITNVVRCRPPNNRTPTQQEILSCRKHLEDQIKIMKPKLILSVGRVASEAILSRKVRILEENAKGILNTSFGIPTVLCVHPSWAIRNGGRTEEIRKAIEECKMFISKVDATGLESKVS